jgi:hypothetical protein
MTAVFFDKARQELEQHPDSANLLGELGKALMIADRTSEARNITPTASQPNHRSAMGLAPFWPAVRPTRQSDFYLASWIAAPTALTDSSSVTRSPKTATRLGRS